MTGIQREINDWSERNFGLLPNTQIPLRISSLLGMVEEIGELCHAILKLSQGIRGTEDEHREAIADSIGDLLVFTLDFCGRNGMDAEELLCSVWAKVQRRDWTKDKLNGVGGQP